MFFQFRDNKDLFSFQDRKFRTTFYHLKKNYYAVEMYLKTTYIVIKFGMKRKFEARAASRYKKKESNR